MKVKKRPKKSTYTVTQKKNPIKNIKKPRKKVLNFEIITKFKKPIRALKIIESSKLTKKREVQGEKWREKAHKKSQDTNMQIENPSSNEPKPHENQRKWIKVD